MGDSPALWELGMGTHGLLGFSAGRSPTCQGVYGAPSCLLLLIITYYYLLLLIITYYYYLLLDGTARSRLKSFFLLPSSFFLLPSSFFLLLPSSFLPPSFLLPSSTPSSALVGWGVGHGKSGQNEKPDAFLKSQRKINFSTFFWIFMVGIFPDPKLDPGFLAQSKEPPTSRLGTSGLWGRARKKWSKSKTRRVFEVATKN